MHVEFMDLNTITPTQVLPENFNKQFLFKEVVKVMDIEDAEKCYFKIIGERIVPDFGIVTTAVIEINLQSFCILSTYNDVILKEIRDIYSEHWITEKGYLVFPLNADLDKVVNKFFNQP